MLDALGIYDKLGGPNLHAVSLISTILDSFYRDSGSWQFLQSRVHVEMIMMTLDSLHLQLSKKCMGPSQGQCIIIITKIGL